MVFNFYVVLYIFNIVALAKKVETCTVVDKKHKTEQHEEASSRKAQKWLPIVKLYGGSKVR